MGTSWLNKNQNHVHGIQFQSVYRSNLCVQRRPLSSLPQWLYGCQVQWIRCTKFNLTKNQKDHNCREEDMPVAFIIACCMLKQHQKRRLSQLSDYAVPKKMIPKNSGQLFNMWSTNGWNPKKGRLFSLIKRISILKLSIQKSSLSAIFQMGSLNWVHGTLSEPPWTTHLSKQGWFQWSVENWIPSTNN